MVMKDPRSVALEYFQWKSRNSAFLIVLKSSMEHNILGIPHSYLYRDRICYGWFRNELQINTSRYFSIPSPIKVRELEFDNFF